jgi:DNA-directed RNA polymerase subunit M/transcription elongation factor TFIIS
MKDRSLVKCRKCGNVWRRDGVKTVIACPLCGKSKDVRDRSAYSKDYSQRHPERNTKLKEWLTINRKAHSDMTRMRLMKSVFTLISKSITPKCANCGCDDVRLLEINHKNGGGGAEYKKGKSAMSFYRDIAMLRRKTDDLELLCRVCNAKHYLELKFGKLPMEIKWLGKK